MGKFRQKLEQYKVGKMYGHLINTFPGTGVEPNDLAIYDNSQDSRFINRRVSAKISGETLIRNRYTDEQDKKVLIIWDANINRYAIWDKIEDIFADAVAFHRSDSGVVCSLLRTEEGKIKKMDISYNIAENVEHMRAIRKGVTHASRSYHTTLPIFEKYLSQNNTFSGYIIVCVSDFLADESQQYFGEISPSRLLRIRLLLPSRGYGSHPYSFIEGEEKHFDLDM